MSTMFADTILIVFISVCTALLAEGKLNDRVAGGTDLPGQFDLCRIWSWICFVFYSKTIILTLLRMSNL